MGQRSYDYPAKGVVRAAWGEFLRGAFSDPANVRGLYLPAVQNLELPGYKALGLLPSNLIGSEHNDDVLSAVQENAGGVRIVPGSVLDGVRFARENEWPRLGFAHLDFDGMYDTYMEEILGLFQVFPGVEDGYLAVTSYSARDEECLRQGQANLAKFYAAVGADRYYQTLDRIVGRWSSYREMVRSGAPQENLLSRDVGLLWWLSVAMLVVQYPQNGYGTLDRDYLAKIGVILDVITDQSTGGSWQGFREDPKLPALLETRRVELWPTDLRRFFYNSQAGQPMWVWFMRICKIEPQYLERTGAELIGQVWELAERAPLVYVGRSGNTVTFT